MNDGPAHYRIIEASHEARLMTKISNMIADGWIPAGGVAHSPEGRLYMQAMWRPPLPAEVKIIMQNATNMEPIKK
jgi:hypothetical protein